MDRLHQQLLEPSTYPEATQAVDFKETHISRIYLTDSHAYKLKKPVDLGFLDFSTLEKRRHFCYEEVRLNRRFTSGIYLGVVALRQLNGKVCFGDRGRLIDYAVQMRRLPESRMLDRLIEAASPELPAAMPQLGMAVHKVSKQAETCHNEALRNAETVRRNCEDNFNQTISAIGSSLTNEAHQLMQSATQRDLAELEGLMLEREAKGFVRDGHGDLHTANICMTDPICIYDCIEFNRRYRVADIIADLAFLLMDLEFRGRRDLAEELMRQYQSHAETSHLEKLLPFYKQYRAWVRGKVNAMLATDPETTTETREHAKKRACRYFNLALGYRIKPTLFLTSGLMGVGKTTLARVLADATGARHLRSDVARKQRAGLSERQASKDDFGTGLYTPEMTARTYNVLFKTAAEHIISRQSVIVDASFAKEDQRQRFIRLAAQAGYPVWLLHLECPDDVTLQRLDQRVGDASDGRRELYARQKEGFSPIQAKNYVVTVDSTRAVDYNVQSLLCRALASQEQFT
ncbi:MAG: AAA family ATPase [Desulfuromonadales bacterium]|nr:AAA family ATPase [Desulfuromonadales bacterium]